MVHESWVLRALVTWLLNAAALLVTAQIMPGMRISGYGVALVAALLLSLVQTVLLPVLALLTLPLTILTLGLFWLVLNGLMLKLTAALIHGFQVGWWAAIFGSILLTILQGLFHWIFRRLA